MMNKTVKILSLVVLVLLFSDCKKQQRGENVSTSVQQSEKENVSETETTDEVQITDETNSVKDRASQILAENNITETISPYLDKLETSEVPSQVTLPYPNKFIMTWEKWENLQKNLPDTDNYDINSLFVWHNNVSNALVKLFNSVYPKTNISRTKKIDHILKGDIDTRIDNVNFDVDRVFTKYKAVGEAKNMLNTNSKFKAEIVAWQKLNKCLDKYIDQSISIAWYCGSGVSGAICASEQDVLESRIYDLQRINKIYQKQGYEQQKIKSESLDIAKNNFSKILKKQTSDVIGKSKEMAKENWCEYTLSDDKKTVKAIKNYENNILNALNDWLNVRNSIQNTLTDDKDKLNFKNSTLKILEDLSEIIPFPMHG